MKHEEMRHKLSDYIDESITPEERTAIDEHLRTCTDCSDALRGLRKTIEHIHEVEEVESPPWMTQKIMAKVREEQEAKKNLLQGFISIFTLKYPIQVVTVLFLAVTAYYVYQGINPSRKYTEEPIGTFAKKEAPAVGQIQAENRAVLEAAPVPKQTPRKPGYESLDMKYSYEKPAAPVPHEQPAVSAAASATKDAPESTRDETEREGLPAAPKTSTPAMIAEQAAPTAGADKQLHAKKEQEPVERKAKNFPAEDREADIQLDIIEHFVQYDLPEKMRIQGLKYSIRKFEKDIVGLRWMQETNAYRSKPCLNRYVIDVELSGKFSKYFYCHDQSQITLLGIFEQRQDTWSEKQP
jgi:hypothetical protein